MNNSGTELEKWLTGGDFLASGELNNDNWEPGFEVDRQVVYFRMGGVYHNVFLRPDGFVKRFYHKIYSLSIDEWHYKEQISLYDSFCHIEVDLELLFQATLKYVQRNIQYIEDINQHIKQVFQGVVADIVHKEMHNLSDGAWVQNGLFGVEKTIAASINELFMVQNVQSQAICRLNTRFEDFPNIQPGRDKVYLHALKKSYELTEQKNHAFFYQQQALKQQKLLHKQEKLEQLKQEAKLERKKRAQEAENKLILLQDQENQLAAQLVIEKRIHAEKIKHQNQLKEMESDAELLNKEKQLAAQLDIEKRIHAENIKHQNQLNELESDAELETEQRHRAKQRVAESQNLTDTLAHKAQLEEMKSQAELQRREKQQLNQTQVHQNKTQAEIERYEQQQETWRDAKLRIHEQQIALKQRQIQLESEAEEEFKQRQQKEKEQYLAMPYQKLEKREDRIKAQKKAEALRHEIQLAVLEKQRLDLELAIKEAQQNSVIDED